MTTKNSVLQGVVNSGVVAVLRGSEEKVIQTAKASINGGIQVIEVTMTVPNAFDVLKELKTTFHSQEVFIGMGTVLDTVSAVQAIQAGADFIVTPHFDKDIVELCNLYQIPIMAGTFTITEMVNAMKAGCDILKLFPGNLTGPKQISNIKGPLPQANVMPTGGVDESNIKDWIKAGAVAVGIGSNLVKAGGTELNHEKIMNYAQKLVHLVKEAREEMK